MASFEKRGTSSRHENIQGSGVVRFRSVKESPRRSAVVDDGGEPYVAPAGGEKSRSEEEELKRFKIAAATVADVDPVKSKRRRDIRKELSEIDKVVAQTMQRKKKMAKEDKERVSKRDELEEELHRLALEEATERLAKIDWPEADPLVAEHDAKTMPYSEDELYQKLEQMEQLQESLAQGSSALSLFAADAMSKLDILHDITSADDVQSRKERQSD